MFLDLHLLYNNTYFFNLNKMVSALRKRAMLTTGFLIYCSFKIKKNVLVDICLLIINITLKNNCSSVINLNIYCFFINTIVVS